MNDKNLDQVVAQSKQKRKDGDIALKRLLRPVRTQLMIGRFVALCSAALAIAPYVALVELGRLLLDAQNAEVAPDKAAVQDLIWWLIATFIGQLTLLFIALAITHFADNILVRNLRQQIIDRVARAPLSWFSDTTSGRVRKAVQDDTRTLHQLVAHAPVEITVAVVVPISLLCYAIYIDWRLGLLAIGTLPLYLLVQLYSMKDMGVKTAEMDNYLGEVSSTAVEFADGIEVVKAFNTVGESHQRYQNATSQFHKFYLAWVSPLLRMSALSEATISVPILVLVNIAGGAALVHAGYISPVDIMTTTLISLVLPATILIIGTTTWSYQLAGNSALRIVEFIDGPELPNTDLDIEVPETTIEFNGVSFAYGDHQVLKDIHLTLPPGSITALIGPSGSGKSTLATMLARFQDPKTGSITIGGVNIQDLPTEKLYNLVSFVLQNPQLPEISIRDNITLAAPDATDEQILEAALNAQILQDIEALPKGWETIVGDDAELSGGQKQRIAIARALLADTPILILDEATAATDPDCEAEIQAALNRLVQGRTVLVIGHKPETIIGADQVVLLRDGRITDFLQGVEVTAEAIHNLMEVHS